MKDNKLKKILKNNSLTIGSWITIPSPNVVEIMANNNFDWLCIDIEHNLINNESLVNLVRTIQSYKIAALVRVPSNNPDSIKLCMDAGADGIIVPMISTYDEAKNAVEYTYYPEAQGVWVFREHKNMVLVLRNTKNGSMKMLLLFAKLSITSQLMIWRK